MGKNMKDGTLVLNVIHGKEMQVEYEKNQILDNINSFFGYNCINNVILKIVQEKIKDRNRIFPKIKNFNSIEKKMNQVQDEQLKNSLNNFFKAYNEKRK